MCLPAQYILTGHGPGRLLLVNLAHLLAHTRRRLADAVYFSCPLWYTRFGTDAALARNRAREVRGDGLGLTGLRPFPERFFVFEIILPRNKSGIDAIILIALIWNQFNISNLRLPVLLGKNKRIIFPWINRVMVLGNIFNKLNIVAISRLLNLFKVTQYMFP
ncbi:MAG: hypothetical protein BWY09_02858 [Candidatus Hydrogenedentes bacterium ADurb.Bin179]|nr:MAG: hypothetical protein BWY09_02858 [Candidatus Hydrogenedentes bacterium ADurb.Bin179]